VLQKVIEIPAATSRELKMRASLMRSVLSHTKEINRLKNKLKKEYFTEAETLSIKKLIKAYKKEKLKILEELGNPHFVYLVPATKKNLKELKQENPQIYEKYTQQNVQQNIQ
jgi:lysyl-tRNA synthetase class II